MATSQAAVRGRLRALLEPVVLGSGFDLEDLTVLAAGRRRVIRVVVDGDGGLSLDDVAQVATVVSEALDASAEADAALGATPYVLEVSSPGVDRPVRTPLHWRRATGRLVRVTVEGIGPLTGRVREATEDGIVLDVDGADRTLLYSTLGAGSVQVEFDRPEGIADGDQPAVGQPATGEPA